MTQEEIREEYELFCKTSEARNFIYLEDRAFAEWEKATSDGQHKADMLPDFSFVDKVGIDHGPVPLLRKARIGLRCENQMVRIENAVVCNELRTNWCGQDALFCAETPPTVAIAAPTIKKKARADEKSMTSLQMLTNEGGCSGIDHGCRALCHTRAHAQSSVVEKGARALESEFRSSLESRHAACRQAFGLAGSRGRSRRALPQFVPPQLSQLVDKSPSGPQWVHEIKLDGYRVAARIDHGRVQLLTDLDWTAKYPSAAAALANLNVKTGPKLSIASSVASRRRGIAKLRADAGSGLTASAEVHLVYYAFDLFASFGGLETFQACR